MLLRISAASFSSPNVAAASGAPLLKAETLRWPAKIGGEEHSTQTEIIMRYVRRAMAGDIARTLCSRQLRAKEKGPGQNRPEPPSVEKQVYRLLEPAPRVVGFLSQAHEYCNDSSIFVVCWIDEEPVVHEALDSGHSASATGFASGTNNRYGSEPRIQEECWFRHDQIGLE